MISAAPTASRGFGGEEWRPNGARYGPGRLLNAALRPGSGSKRNIYCNAATNKNMTEKYPTVSKTSPKQKCFVAAVAPRGCGAAARRPNGMYAARHGAPAERGPGPWQRRSKRNLDATASPQRANFEKILRFFSSAQCHPSWRPPGGAPPRRRARAVLVRDTREKPLSGLSAS